MQPVSADANFPAIEKAILKFWKEQGIVSKGLEVNKGKRPFTFYDGPPFASGLPHYGHILAGTLKDIVPRYWAMKGHYVSRRWGWDCHGLPIEFEMEKELGLSGVHDVEKFGVAKFNEACRGIVQRYAGEWKETIERSGRWADFEHGYKTMDRDFMESVWSIVKTLWNKGLIYEGYRVMPYSWRISTPLSNFEAGLNYKRVQDPAVTVRFRSKTSKRSLLAWTTTPWTLPSNLGLMVNPDVAYCEVEEVATGERLVLAEARLPAYFPKAELYRLHGTFDGKVLGGEAYEPLFPHFASHGERGAFRVLFSGHVTTTDGTGIVHCAPAFGEDDFEVGKKAGIGLVDPIDAEGKFTSDVPEYAGLNVKDADKNILRDLKAKGLLFRHETIEHNYPFCWRSDTPLIYKAISTWFVKIDPLKAKLIENNQTTRWVPEHLRDGRFGNWLAEARDWNISRNRFWGTPIPIWRSDDPKEKPVCVGSIDELTRLSGKKLDDIHKHFVDEVTFKSPTTGKVLKRIPEVLDCWFESGSMPYAQMHYPFENKERFDRECFPADFIAEGLDQTRGWFYTLSVLAAALDRPAPFRNVIVNGLVLAEDGKKMSKRLKNYPDPTHVFDAYGADALRAYLMSSPASHADDLRFSENGVKEIVRSVLLPFWNAYSFFVTYARADQWEPTDADRRQVPTTHTALDKWLVSRLHSLILFFDEKMADYRLYEVIPRVTGFIEELTNWYIRLNRRRFWSETKDADKEAAYSTLFYTLHQFSRILAPILPFVTEAIYQNLKLAFGSTSVPESVHLSAFPEVQTSWIDRDLEKRMSLIQTVVSMGRTCRNNHKIKTRQPLREILIITQNPADRETIEAYRDWIASELNVKKVSFTNDEGKWVDFVAKPNSKVLGPRLGPRMKAFSEKIRALSARDIASIEEHGQLTIDGEPIYVSDVVIERKPKGEGLIQTQGATTVWLDNHLDEGLLQEGLAREFVNRVQKIRKDSGFEVSDTIRVAFQAPDTLASAIEKHRAYICEEILASELSRSLTSIAGATAQEIDGDAVAVSVVRV